MREIPARPRDHPLLQRHRLALAVAIALMSLALSLFVVMAFDAGVDAAQSLDDGVRDLLQAMQWGPLTWFADLLAVIGAWYVTWPVRFVVTGFLALRRRWEAMVAWVLAILVYEPLVGILKGAYERSRPPLAEGVTGFSFPSGHSVVGAAVAIGLVIVLVPAGPRRFYYEVLAAGFAFFMAVSRVYLDVHWFTDVVAGTALGAAVMIGIAAIVHEVGDRLHLRNHQGPAG